MITSKEAAKEGSPFQSVSTTVAVVYKGARLPDEHNVLHK